MQIIIIEIMTNQVSFSSNLTDLLQRALHEMMNALILLLLVF